MARIFVSLPLNLDYAGVDGKNFCEFAIELDYAGVDGKNFCEVAIEIGLCWSRWQEFL